MYKDKTTLAMEKRMKSVRWDIIDMAKRMARELNEHYSASNEIEDDMVYMIAVYNDKYRERWMRDTGTLVIFNSAARFETRGEARAHIAKYEMEGAKIELIDLVEAEIVSDFTDEIYMANECYKARKLCPVCKKNAAVKVILKQNQHKAEKVAKYLPCRACDNGYDEELDVTDFLIKDSMMARAQVEDAIERQAPTKSDGKKKQGGSEGVSATYHHW